jgi:thiamine pyrophosphate-dependent acetolactate synthase large subunit-like protein
VCLNRSVLLFRDVSLYTETISSPTQAAAVIHQAIAAAYAGPMTEIDVIEQPSSRRDQADLQLHQPSHRVG